MKYYNKKTNGITLISLVITIVIMLILATVSINLIIGNNGLFNKTKIAKEKSKEGQNKENNLLSEYEKQIDLLNGTSNENNQEKVEITCNNKIKDIWKTWLILGGITNPDTYNGQDILSNSELVDKLMANDDAIRYLVNSKEFLLPSVLNSQYAYNKLINSNAIVKIPVLTKNDNDKILQQNMLHDFTSGSNYYDYYCPFDDKDATYVGTKTTDLNTVGDYIGYDFEKPISVINVKGKIRMLGFKIQYSDDKENWNDAYTGTSQGSNYGDDINAIITSNTGLHRYWRLYVNDRQIDPNWSAVIYNLQFYGVGEENLSSNNDVSYDKNIYDNWLTWLKLANIENPTTYNNQDILNDTSLMDIVMNNENSLSYLMKSRNYLLPAVLNNSSLKAKLFTSTKIETIPKATSATDKMLFNSIKENYSDEWGTFNNYFVFDVDNSSAAASLYGGDASIGSSIGYDFGYKVYLIKFNGKVRLLGYKIQYSDDNANWNDAYSSASLGSNTADNIESETINNNVGAHRYWRLYTSGGQQASGWAAVYYSLQFYCIKDV